MADTDPQEPHGLPDLPTCYRGAVAARKRTSHHARPVSSPSPRPVMRAVISIGYVEVVKMREKFCSFR